MPTVRILAGLAGVPYQPGEELTLPADVAKQLVAEGRAELVRGAGIETPERAVTEKTRRAKG